MRLQPILAAILALAACTPGPTTPGPDSDSSYTPSSSSSSGAGAEEIVYGDRCNGAPIHDKVTRVLDGDTVEISSDLKVRLLLIDTPEISHNSHEVAECFGDEAREFTTDHLLGKWVDLEYDVECTDRYGRLLAYLTTPVTHAPEGTVFNTLLLSEGYATVLYIPPNGADHVSEYRDIAQHAENSSAGGYGVCANFNP